MAKRYVLYNVDMDSYLGMLVDGEQCHRFFTDEQVDFFEQILKLNSLPDQHQEEWCENWQGVNESFIQLRPNLEGWWFMLYDDETKLIDHKSAFNFELLPLWRTENPRG